MISNIRHAKAHLSALLDRAAKGEEIIITSDGRPKARIVAIDTGARPYQVHRALLRGKASPANAGADRIIRADRDSRD